MKEEKKKPMPWEAGDPKLPEVRAVVSEENREKSGTI